MINSTPPAPQPHAQPHAEPQPQTGAQAARLFNNYARRYHAGAFATPIASEMTVIMAGGSDKRWYWWGDGPGATAGIGRKLNRPGRRTDFTGRPLRMPAGSRVIDHIVPGVAGVPNLSRWQFIWAYVEDPTLTDAMLDQGREIVAVRVSAASEIIACWGLPGTGHRYPPHDHATITQLPLHVSAEAQGQALVEVARVSQWHDDFPYYCVSEDTEIYTRAGWRRHDQVSVGDEVLTLDHDTGAAQWQPLLRVNVYGRQRRPMLHMHGRQHDSLTTLDHRWPVITYRYGSNPRHDRRIVRSRNLKAADRIPTAAPAADLPTEAKYADAFVELVGWFWTEGWVRADGSGAIAQSHRANPRNTTRIRVALAAVFGPATPHNTRTAAPAWYETPNGPMTTFWLNRAAMAALIEVAPGKIVRRDFVLTLTRAQLELFIQTSIDADGTRPARGCPLIYQKSRAALEPLELAAILTGRTPTFRRSPAAQMWSLILMDRTTVAPLAAAAKRQHANTQVVEHDGVVWCPTTANGTWLARRNDRIFYTGNSDGTWGAVSLRGFNPADPTWGIKPAEMSKNWWAEHPEAKQYDRCDWTTLAPRCPTLVDLVGAVTAPWGGQLERVRLLRMAGNAGKGGRLSRHTDITDRAAGTADGQILRLHIPLVTDPRITMSGWNLAGEEHAVHLHDWGLYYLDARKPHAVHNAAGIDRIHLVIDVTATRAARAAIAAGVDHARVRDPRLAAWAGSTAASTASPAGVPG